MVASFLVLLVAAAGFGRAVPVGGPGIRLGAGALLLVLVLHLGLMAGAPFRLTSWAVLAAAALLLAAGLRAPPREDAWRVPLHPAFVLPALVLAAMLAGGAGYQPVAWDEFSNWMFWARQIVLADGIRGPGFESALPGYTLGWPALMAFPQAPFAAFDEARAPGAAILLHIGALAVVFDLARHLLSGPAGFAPRPAFLAAWLVVCLLLALEAMWTLAPPLLLIEKPQIYGYVVLFALLLRALAGGAERSRWMLAAGIALAACYAIKVAAITLLPAVAVFWGVFAWRLARRDGWRDAARPAAIAGGLLFGPFVLFWLGWTLLNPSGESCLSAPVAFLLQGGVPAPGQEALSSASRLGAALSAYYGAYKLPVSLLALAGLLLGLCAAITRPLAIGLGVWWAVYLAGLWLSYLGCFTGFEAEVLASHQRYARVPLRVAHAAGLALLAGFALHLLRRGAGGVAVRRAAAGAAVLAIGGALAWQGIGTARTFGEMAHRAGDGERGRTVVAIRDEAESLSRHLRRLGIADPEAILVAQRSDGFERIVARYYGLARRRGEGRIYHMHGAHSWGPDRADVWMQALPAEALAAAFGRAAVIWPVTLDDYVAPLLRGPGAACEGPVAEHFLIRRDGAFLCVPKAAR